MTSFGWKRKVGQNVSKDMSTKFSVESDRDDVPKTLFWVQSFKRKKLTLQENCKTKCEEFKTAGVKFAESQRFKEAISEWDKALNLVPDDYKILEMKAQALLLLNTPFEAVQCAERAVKVNPQWWVAFQTLGRSQLGIGDVQMEKFGSMLDLVCIFYPGYVTSKAKKSFSKAIHLNPTIKELWEEDLKWTLSLIYKKNKVNSEKEQSNSKLNEPPEITYDDEGYILNSNDGKDVNIIHCRN